MKKILLASVVACGLFSMGMTNAIADCSRCHKGSKPCNSKTANVFGIKKTNGCCKGSTYYACPPK